MENSIMSNLSTILGGSSSGSSINPSYAAIPLNELTPGPLPTFATWQWYWGDSNQNSGYALTSRIWYCRTLEI